MSLERALRDCLDPARKAAHLDLYARHVSSGKREFFRAAGLDLLMGRREGIYFEDVGGRRLINAHCNGGVFNLGHRHPRLVEALRRGLEALDIGNHHLMSAARALLAERLARSAPGDLEHVVFGAGGGEAIDLAIKLARAHTGRPGIISALGGYHGHTGLALAAGDEQYRAPFGPLAPGFRQVPFDDVAALERALDDQTAAVLLETVPATLGMPIASPGYFAEVRRLCDERGALLIIDEVQSGLGRTGRLWGIEHYGVVPDLMVVAKGLGGGLYPLAATLYRPLLDDFLRRNPFIHVSTTGGSELGCVVGLEVMELTEEAGFLERVQARAAQIATGLAALNRRHPGLLLEVRQLGMMAGLVTPNQGLGPLLSRAAIEEGLFCVYANNDRAVVQFLLPLVIEESECAEALARLERACQRLEGLLAGARS